MANDHLLWKQVLSQLSCGPISWLLQFIFYHLRCNFNRSQTRESRNTRNNIGFRNGEAIADSLAYGEKTRPGHCPEQQLIAQLPSMINEAREVPFATGDSRHPLCSL
jgi:hypothetical protein